MCVLDWLVPTSTTVTKCVATQGMIQNFVRSTLSLTFVIAAAKVVFSIKGRMTRESSWQLELKGDLTRQRRVEAVDKLLSVLTLLVASVFGLQAIGLDGGSHLLLPALLATTPSPDMHVDISCQACRAWIRTTILQCCLPLSSNDLLDYYMHYHQDGLHASCQNFAAAMLGHV